MTVLAANPLGGNLIMAAYIFVAMVGLVFGYYTLRGSGINVHPWDGYGAPGSKLPDEFTQFADRQVHDHDIREAEIERRVDARMGLIPIDVTRGPVPDTDISIDEANRLLAEEAAARKGAKAAEEDDTRVR